MRQVRGADTHTHTHTHTQVGSVLSRMSAEEQGHLSSFLFMVAIRLEPPGPHDTPI